MEFNLADLWERVADAVPDHEALVCGDRRLTLRASPTSAPTRLAHHLAALGIGAGDHVALYLYNGTEYLEAMLAAFKLRAVPINVNYRYVEDELRYLFDDADAERGRVPPRVRAEARRDPRDAAAAAHASSRSTTAPARDRRDSARSSTRPRSPRASPTRDFGPRSADDLYILYTGGTTGMPEGRDVARTRTSSSARSAAGAAATTPITTPEEIAERCSSRAPACAARVPVHARHRALDGVRRAVRRRHGRHLARAPPRPARSCGS